jgi:predicted nuclease of predicted toxin-antitoxin system
MRFLIDMPLTPSLATFLRELGHDAIHVADIGEAYAADSTLLLRARAEARVVITADLDFGRLMAEVPEKSPGIILLRGGSYSDKEMIDLVSRVLRSVEHEQLAESLVVVDRHRIRRRQLPII